MAKYDPDRIAETAEPYAPGTSGIEPLCDEFGRMVLAPGSGGGGGDATAANQVLGLTALDQIYDALQLVGTEATSADILAAVQSLAGGASLGDLAAALAPLATEATQADILAALEAQAIDVGLIQTNVALLVPDLDSVRVATEATATATGTTGDADTTSTLIGLLKWIKARLPTALGSQGALKVEGVASGTPQPTSNTAGAQVDGHSATIGTTSDASTATTVIGRLQKLVSLLPTALGAGGGLKIDGSGTALPVSGTVTSAPATNAAAIPTREVPAYAAGRQYHTQTSAGIANAASKLLFGFSNSTGGNVYIDRINLSNTQTGTIAGVVGQMNVQTGSSAITGGTTINGVSSPSLVASYRDPSLADPSGLTWNTNGTLGGTVKTIESCLWSTDELNANGTGMACEIAALGVYNDPFNFRDDPIVVPNGYSIAVVCDSALTNGSTKVDFNLHQ
jgi:hypothetical protein